jgi:hypothetical protein
MRIKNFRRGIATTAFGCAITRSTNSCWTLFSAAGGGRASTFIGLNYYGRVRFHHFRAMIPASGTPVKTLKDFGFVCDDMVERYPEGLGKNSAVSATKIPPADLHHGTWRGLARRKIPRARPARKSRRAAPRDGRRRGRARFFYWSLLDNFEWQFGYTKKFGLLAVDFADEKLPRTMKPLGRVYAKICRDNFIGISVRSCVVVRDDTSTTKKSKRIRTPLLTMYL